MNKQVPSLPCCSGCDEKEELLGVCRFFHSQKNLSSSPGKQGLPRTINSIIMDDNQSVVTTSERIDYSNIANLKRFDQRWTIDCDEGLLEYMKGFSGRLFTNMNTVRDSVDDLIFDTQSCEIKIRNAFNEFIMLSNTQFIENRVIVPPTTSTPTTNNMENEITVKELTPEEKQQRFTTAIKYGLNAVLESCTIPIDEGDMMIGEDMGMNGDSLDQFPMDAEEEEYNRQAEEFMKNTVAKIDYIQQIDPVIMKKRTLPYIIGSNKFLNNDLAGIIPNEEEEQLKLMTHNPAQPQTMATLTPASSLSSSAIPPPPNMNGGVDLAAFTNSGTVPPPPPSFGTIPPPPPTGSVPPPPPMSTWGVPPPPPDASLKPKLSSMNVLGQQEEESMFSLDNGAGNGMGQPAVSFLGEEEQDTNNMFGTTSDEPKQPMDIRTQLAALMRKGTNTSTTTEETQQPSAEATNNTQAPSSTNHTQSLDNIFGSSDDGLFGGGLFSDTTTNTKKRNSDEFDLNQLEKDLEFGGFGVSTTATSSKTTTTAPKSSFFEEEEDSLLAELTKKQKKGTDTSFSAAPSATTSGLFDEEFSIPTKKAPTTKPANTTPKLSLFDEEEDGLFGGSDSTKKTTTAPPVVNTSTVSSISTAKSTSSLFDDEEDFMPTKKSTPTPTQAQPPKKKSLFDDEEDFTVPVKTTSPVVAKATVKKTASSLFDDEEDFMSSPSTTTTTTAAKKVVEEKVTSSPPATTAPATLSTSTTDDSASDDSESGTAKRKSSRASIQSKLGSSILKGLQANIGGSYVPKKKLMGIEEEPVEEKQEEPEKETTPVVEEKQEEQPKVTIQPKKSSLFDDEEDFAPPVKKEPVVASPVVVPKEEPKKKASSLFDDEEDFMPKTKTETKAPPKTETKVDSPAKKSSLFDDEEDFATTAPARKKSVNKSPFQDQLAGLLSRPPTAPSAVETEKVDIATSEPSDESTKTNFARDGNSGVKLEHASLGRPKRKKNNRNSAPVVADEPKTEEKKIE